MGGPLLLEGRRWEVSYISSVVVNAAGARVRTLECTYKSHYRSDRNHCSRTTKKKRDHTVASCALRQ